MQEQQQKQPKLAQKLQVATRLAKIMLRATRQDDTALQIEDIFVKSFEQLHQGVKLFEQLAQLE